MLWRRVWKRQQHAGNERLAAFVARRWKSLFTFLTRRDVDTTNERAEQTIRPAVIFGA